MSETDQYYLNEQKLPLVIEANQRQNLKEYLSLHKAEILEKLYQHGAILFRNFDCSSVEDFQESAHSLDENTLEYTFRSTPRTQVSGNILTSTEYPSLETIPMHNELAYNTKWPMKLWFYCAIPAEAGGETPLVNSKAVLEKLGAEITQKLENQKFLYVRNYRSMLDLPWQQVFQTKDKEAVAQFCQKNDIQYEWITPEHLRTKHLAQIIAEHPITKEKVWFNQAHLFHVSSLKPSYRELLVNSFGIENIPRNVYKENGTALEASLLEKVRNIYEELKVTFIWQKQDVLLVDNMLVAHGRHPYQGKRKVLVAMTEGYDNWTN